MKQSWHMNWQKWQGFRNVFTYYPSMVLWWYDRNKKYYVEISKRLINSNRSLNSFDNYFIPTLIDIFNILQHRDTQETLTVLDRLDLDTDKPSAEETAKKFGFEDDYYSGELSWWQKTKPKIWSIFDEPYSSSAAKVRRLLFLFDQPINVCCTENPHELT